MNFVLENIIRENVKKLVPYSSARSEYFGEKSVFLDANENPFNTGFNRYPDPYQRKLKKKIAQLKSVSPEKIFLGNGSDEIIDLLFRAFCEPGQGKAYILPPTYGMYEVASAINNVDVIRIPLTPDFQVDTKTVLKQISSTEVGVGGSLLFICSPNNPTGNAVEKQVIELLLQNFKGLVVLDEAYIDFSPQKSAVSLLDKYPNLVILQTFSKAWGMAGIRLGMGFCSEEIVQVLNKIKPPYNVNEITQEKAMESFSKPARKEQAVQQILMQRKMLEMELSQLPMIQKVFPSDANFLLVKTTNADAIYRLLKTKKIIVRNRSNLPLCENCLRITVGTEQETKLLIKTLKAFSNEKGIIS
ncbi:MAG: histidinol-phosphate transaminase [Flavobacteriales bacterium]|nr:MAG: histidinol-phosphate transaminase [Flavobacteriales bacterium]